MTTQSSPLKHFRWRATLIRFLVNVITLFIVVVLTPKVYFVDPTFLHLLLMALVLGILNATIKPIIQFLTLPFIFISYGLIIVLINSLMLWMLSWIFPEALGVDRLFWALVAGALYGIISSFLESLCGLNELIIPDDSPEDIALRERVDEESVGVVSAFVDNQESKSQTSAALAEVTAEVTAEEKDEERDEEKDETQDRAQDYIAPVEAVEEIAEVEPQIPSADGETAEEEAETVANKFGDDNGIATDEAEEVGS